uniref:Ashwin n=2 Tax=Lygus hesperus TaxID=30085 RepID=A0A0A9XSA5_LYGHE
MDEEGIPTFRLLQPELMTSEELVEVLQRYKLKCDLRTIEINELISIYKRLALPLPQRTYGSTWRERLLAKKQNRRKISLSDTTGNTGVSAKSKSSNNNSSPRPANPSAQRDRLKPPLDVSGAREKKIIKISSSSKKDAVDCVNDNDSSRKSSETSKADSSDEKLAQRKHKRIRIDFSDSSERSTPTPKVVSTKRLSSSSDEKSPSHPVSKHRRIII